MCLYAREGKGGLADTAAEEAAVGRKDKGVLSVRAWNALFCASANMCGLADTAAAAAARVGVCLRREARGQSALCRGRMAGCGGQQLVRQVSWGRAEARGAH